MVDIASEKGFRNEINSSGEDPTNNVKKDLKVFFFNKVKRQPMELEKIFSNYIYRIYNLGFPGDSDSKEYACNVGHLSSISGSGRSPGGQHSNPFCILAWRILKDRGALWATVHEVSKSRTQLKDLAHSTCI